MGTALPRPSSPYPSGSSQQCRHPLQPTVSPAAKCYRKLQPGHQRHRRIDLHGRRGCRSALAPTGNPGQRRSGFSLRQQCPVERPHPGRDAHRGDQQRRGRYLPHPQRCTHQPHLLPVPASRPPKKRRTAGPPPQLGIPRSRRYGKPPGSLARFLGTFLTPPDAGGVHPRGRQRRGTSRIFFVFVRIIPALRGKTNASPQYFQRKTIQDIRGKNSPETWYLPIKEKGGQMPREHPEILRPSSGLESPDQ